MPKDRSFIVKDLRCRTCYGPVEVVVKQSIVDGEVISGLIYKKCLEHGCGFTPRVIAELLDDALFKLEHRNE